MISCSGRPGSLTRLGRSLRRVIMNLNRDHPSPEQLAAFDAGLLRAADREEVERHVAECSVCCRILEQLPEDAFSARIREFAGRSTSVATETPLPEQTETTAPELPPGLREHPRYQVLSLLGTGGMGTVYRAVQRHMDRVVALKVLHRGLTDRPGFAERFRNEVKALARLNHPNVVAAYDADQGADLHFLVMEFVEGTTLDALVAQRGPRPVTEACDIARQAATGLQHAFEQGLVHRDIKPGNLLLTPAGVVKVADFGLARLVGLAEPAVPGSAPIVLGTPEYMAPEQAREPQLADIRSDLYSLGCTLYFLLAGRPPFLGGSQLQTLLDHQDVTPPAIAGLPPAVSAVINRLLAKNPAQRFATPAEVAEALTQAVGSRESLTSSRRNPRRWLWPVAAVVVLVGVITAGVIAFGSRDRQAQSLPPPPPPDQTGEPTPPQLPVAPAPRLVDRPPRATSTQLAALKRESAMQMVDWVRMNNRWRPDAEIAVKTAASVEEALPKVEEFVLTFGGGLLKSGRPTRLIAQTGGFFVFELTPEQAQGVNLGPMGSVFASHTHPTDTRRSAPRVTLSELRIDDADSHPPGPRINGTITCEFRVAPRTGDYLRITHYHTDGRRVMFL